MKKLELIQNILKANSLNEADKLEYISVVIGATEEQVKEALEPEHTEALLAAHTPVWNKSTIPWRCQICWLTPGTHP